MAGKERLPFEWKKNLQLRAPRPMHDEPFDPRQVALIEFAAHALQRAVLDRFRKGFGEPRPWADCPTALRNAYRCQAYVALRAVGFGAAEDHELGTEAAVAAIRHEVGNQSGKGKPWPALKPEIPAEYREDARCVLRASLVSRCNRGLPLLA